MLNFHRYDRLLDHTDTMLDAIEDELEILQESKKNLDLNDPNLQKHLKHYEKLYVLLKKSQYSLEKLHNYLSSPK